MLTGVLVGAALRRLRARSSSAWSATRWPAPTSSACRRARRSAPCSPSSCRAGTSAPVTAARARSARSLTVAAIYLLAIKQGISSYRLVLVGIGITAMLDSGVAYLLTRAELNDAQRATVWLTGSLNGRGWEYVRPARLALAILRAGRADRATRQLRVLELGDEPRAGLGVGLAPVQAGLTLGGAGARRGRHRRRRSGRVRGARRPADRPPARRRPARRRSPAGARRRRGRGLRRPRGPAAVRPHRAPVGVITAIIGAPYLLWLLARANRIGTGG